MEYNKEKTSMVNGIGLPISLKSAIEISNHIKGKTVEKAKKILQDAIEIKTAIPMRKYNRDMGHKKGMASGRYNVKACTQIQKLIDSAVANAQFKGLNTSSLVLVEMVPNKGIGVRRSGRHPGRNMKNTNLKITLEEKMIPKKEKKQTKKVENKKSENKTEKIEDKQ